MDWLRVVLPTRDCDRDGIRGGDRRRQHRHAAAPRDEAWLRRNEVFVAESRRRGDRRRIPRDFLTDLWRHEGRAVWERHGAPLRAANVGIGGDRTWHLLS